MAALFESESFYKGDMPFFHGDDMHPGIILNKTVNGVFKKGPGYNQVYLGVLGRARMHMYIKSQCA